LAQLLSALSHIHARRLLHRDLTSRNVLLSSDTRVIKVADFGLAKMLSSKRSRAASVVGTPEYMSPELCRGEAYGVASDVWALGCVLYELLTFRTPFQASTVPALVLAILRSQVMEPSIAYSREVRYLARSMLVSDPQRRITLQQASASPSVAIELVKLATSLGAIGTYLAVR
jgi:serine/threonine protein kinase